MYPKSWGLIFKIWDSHQEIEETIETFVLISLHLLKTYLKNNLCWWKVTFSQLSNADLWALQIKLLKKTTDNAFYISSEYVKKNMIEKRSKGNKIKHKIIIWKFYKYFLKVFIWTSCFCFKYASVNNLHVRTSLIWHNRNS